MTVKTDVVFFDKDIGKNLYRKKTYYTVCIEQDVLAKDKDEAEQLFLDLRTKHLPYGLKTFAIGFLKP